MTEISGFLSLSMDLGSGIHSVKRLCIIIAFQECIFPEWYSASKNPITGIHIAIVYHFSFRRTFRIVDIY